ncbi:hypothetical protein EA796_00950 [Pseudomonas sp. AOB-7]|uniref:hypothetical protein n=1 Tax=Pseudomonas sp. AOB-7 TaxID=2482750 RepID=UPI000EFC1972|nr:hypothetical protein [Pseudomonas sp. AOB-7]RMH86430.1 hypothetical protein EA796_00950 [Pseudomonas sp. AOB-7]
MEINGANLNGATLNGATHSWAGQTETVTPPASSRWRLRVLLDGLDVSARLTGQLAIDREEGAARLARLSLRPQPGLLDLDVFTGKPLQVYRQRLQGTAVVSEQLRFTGVTLRPSLDATRGVVGLTGTCDLQNRIEQLPIEAIDALVPGYYAEAVFGEIESHWQYAQDRCSTLMGNLESAPDGSLRMTPWTPAAVAHFTFGADAVLDGSVEVQPADVGQLLNQVELVVEYRYSRLRQRQQGYTWGHPAGSFCVWRLNSTELPTRSMLRDALDQGGWQSRGTAMETLPPSAPNPCLDGIPWNNPYTADPFLLGFHSTLIKRFTQTITERYHITLDAVGSQAAFGAHPGRERYSDEVAYEAGDWENQPADLDPPGAVRDELDDWVIDQDEPARRDNTLHTVLRCEQVRIAASHRQTRVLFQTPITDAVYDTLHTARLAALGTVAQGKVVRVQERWDMDGGSEVATLELAIRRGGAAVAADPLILPARPTFDLSDVPPPSPPLLTTQLGGAVSSPPFDESRDGFSGNYSITAPGSETYPRQLRLTTPDIPARHRDPVETETVARYSLNLATDLLLTEVP